MKYTNYSDTHGFIKDQDIIDALCIERSFEDLLEYFCRDDFLEIDPTMRIPFFAETRDYVGAKETEDPRGKWIVKQAKEGDLLPTEMAMTCFFLDFFTKTISAPVVITRINGVFYKATKLVPRAEQLSGANYTEIRQLREQLLLDMVNRWIYSDEDRNPNNYMIKYNSANDQIVIAIDFGNADLLHDGVKIHGTNGAFGWQRVEKTRYLTPLKAENFLIYDMEFFGMRFGRFLELDTAAVTGLVKAVFRHDPECKSYANLIASNVMERRDYLYDYFQQYIPAHVDESTDDKYKDFGKVFGKIYNRYE